MDTVITPSTVDFLRAKQGSAAQPFLIDVRRAEAFTGDTHIIAGATRREPFSVADWLKFVPRHRPVVVYCVHGHEISKNVAAALCNAGVDATYLAGGIEAWREAGGAICKKSSSPTIPSLANAPSVWVTRERPKIDRIACPWLVRRFIDPLAEFLYVPAGEVLSFAAKNNAIAYDVPNVQFTHRGARGEQCSFDALIADFDLHDAALDALANIVRGADTGDLDLTPQSHGLLAVSLGLSALYQDDQEMLKYGIVIYDALYAWLKTAQTEIHNADMFKEFKKA